jgi:hypothetical protein
VFAALVIDASTAFPVPMVEAASAAAELAALVIDADTAMPSQELPATPMPLSELPQTP